MPALFHVLGGNYDLAVFGCGKELVPSGAFFLASAPRDGPALHTELPEIRRAFLACLASPLLINRKDSVQRGKHEPE
jgi:hypothetical protein